MTRNQLFQVVDQRRHIMRKDGSGTDIAQLAAMRQARNIKPVRSAAPNPVESVFENSVVGQVVLDANSIIVLANRTARRILAIGSTELGRHLREAELSYRLADLRGPVERVLRDRRQVTIYDVAWQNATASDEPMTLDITVAPLESNGGVIIS